MPQYTYINDDTGEVIHLIQTMREKHEYFDESGKEWRRIFYSPNASVDSISNLDPFDTRSYVEKTGKMKGTVGSLWDISKEASIRRSEKLGHEDPVKREYFNKYEKENKVKHFYDKPTKIEKNGFSIDFSSSNKRGGN